MKKYHVQARQYWQSVSINGEDICLKHLDVHEVIFKGIKEDFKFLVTYGLHCFAKNDQEYSIPFKVSDSHEERDFNIERYTLSKALRPIIEKLDSGYNIYQTAQNKHFIFESQIVLGDEEQLCKICLCIFKENRLARIHVTSAFVLNEESQNRNKPGKSGSIFKIATDVKKQPKHIRAPKEATRK